MLSTLSVGLLAYKKGGQTHELAVTWGYAEVGPDKVTILAEAAERVEEIDLERAEAARKRAMERISKREEDVDVDRAMAALEKATVRLRIAGRQN